MNIERKNNSNKPTETKNDYFNKNQSPTESKRKITKLDGQGAKPHIIEDYFPINGEEFKGSKIEERKTVPLIVAENNSEEPLPTDTHKLVLSEGFLIDESTDSHDTSEDITEDNSSETPLLSESQRLKLSEGFLIVDDPDDYINEMEMLARREDRIIKAVAEKGGWKNLSPDQLPAYLDVISNEKSPYYDKQLASLVSAKIQLNEGFLIPSEDYEATELLLAKYDSLRAEYDPKGFSDMSPLELKTLLDTISDENSTSYNPTGAQSIDDFIDPKMSFAAMHLDSTHFNKVMTYAIPCVMYKESVEDLIDKAEKGEISLSKHNLQDIIKHFGDTSSIFYDKNIATKASNITPIPENLDQATPADALLNSIKNTRHQIETSQDLKRNVRNYLKQSPKLKSLDFFHLMPDKLDKLNFNQLKNLQNIANIQNYNGELYNKQLAQTIENHIQKNLPSIINNELSRSWLKLPHTVQIDLLARLTPESLKSDLVEQNLSLIYSEISRLLNLSEHGDLDISYQDRDYYNEKISLLKDLKIAIDDIFDIEEFDQNEDIITQTPQQKPVTKAPQWKTFAQLVNYAITNEGYLKNKENSKLLTQINQQLDAYAQNPKWLSNITISTETLIALSARVKNDKSPLFNANLAKAIEDELDWRNKPMLNKTKVFIGKLFNFSPNK